MISAGYYCNMFNCTAELADVNIKAEMQHLDKPVVSLYT